MYSQFFKSKTTEDDDTSLTDNESFDLESISTECSFHDSDFSFDDKKPELIELPNQQNDSITNKSISDETRLVCHPIDDLPAIVIRCADQLYHPQCFKCSECNTIIKSSIACIVSDSPKTIICERCAKRLSQISICSVCQAEIDDETSSICFDNEFYVHHECLHCAFCSKISGEESCFSFYKCKSNSYCICNNCRSIIMNHKAPKGAKEFQGRFPYPVIEERKLRCETCNESFVGGFFFLRGDKVICYDCVGNDILKN